MNPLLQSLQEKILSGELDGENLDIIKDLIKKINKELTILEFKLDRTEKVKRTTSVLLEETIDELEQKRKDMEETNAALTQSLDELKATQKQLIHSEKMASLGELTAGIAHEIQNPLNFVNNFSEVSSEMIDEANEEIENGDMAEAKEILNDLKSNLEKINHHGQRASGIVKSMLDHSRTTKGEKEETDINTLCDEYLRLAYHGMRAKDRSFNANFELNLDKTLPHVNVVSQDIGRVLLNLINNAFQAISDPKISDRTDRSVSALTDQSDLQGLQNLEGLVKVQTKNLTDSIEITVSDNGSGISDSLKDKIFQPFFTTKPTGQGTGLGLSLSYDIIKSHGGKILLESEKGEGSTFTIILPV